jgi:hypothetical protein
MYEVNYKEMVRNIIPTCQCHLIHKDIYLVHFNIYNEPHEKMVIRNFKSKSIASGESEFQAWKNAYYAIKNISFEKEAERV